MQRALGLGAVVLLAAMTTEHLFASTPRFSGAPIAIREWMVVVASVTLAGHAIILALLLAGTFAVRTIATTGLRVARGALIAALMCCAIFGVMPWLVGNGPFAADSAPVAAMRALAFGAPTLRAVGIAALLWAWEPRLPQWSRGATLGLALIDVVICLQAWLATPTAVSPLIHPAHPRPLLLAAATLCAIALLGLATSKLDADAAH